MKVLLVQTSFLGDVILSTPLITLLKKKYPQAELWLMTTPQSVPLLSKDPLISGIISFDKHGQDGGIGGFIRIVRELKKHNFSKVYSLHRSFRTALILKLAGIEERVGFKDAKLSSLYTRTVIRPRSEHDVIRNLSLGGDIDHLSEQDKEIRLVIGSDAQKILDKYSISSPFAIIAPGSVWATKRWSYLGYRKVVKELTSKYALNAVIVGASNERKICDMVAASNCALNLCSQTTISELMALVSKARLVVCNDSMALHLASAFKVPNVAIFCATSPTFGFGPWRNRAIVVEKRDLECKPCARHGANRCPTGTELCMVGLHENEVLAAIEKLLTQGKNGID